MKKTGWPPGLLQDDCSKLSRWFASRIDARETVRRVFRQEKGQDMTDETIEMKEVCAHPPVELIISEPQPKGWLAFYRSSSVVSWNVIYPSDYSNRNWLACPSPLFETRDDAIHEIQKYAKNSGGEARLVLVTL